MCMLSLLSVLYSTDVRTWYNIRLIIIVLIVYWIFPVPYMLQLRIIEYVCQHTTCLKLNWYILLTLLFLINLGSSSCKLQFDSSLIIVHILSFLLIYLTNIVHSTSINILIFLFLHIYFALMFYNVYLYWS